MGDYKESKKQLSDYIEWQIKKTCCATRSAIVLEATKDVLGKHLLQLQDLPAKTLTQEELEPIFDGCKDMSSPNLRTNVVTFNYHRRFDWMERITMLMGLNTWAFVQKNMFPNQGDEQDMVLVFKTSQVVLVTRVDLAKNMQPGGDL